MPDISMCKGEGCDKKLECYRFLATPNTYWQAYMSPTPEGCEFFWQQDESVKSTYRPTDEELVKRSRIS